MGSDPTKTGVVLLRRQDIPRPPGGFMALGVDPDGVLQLRGRTGDAEAVGGGVAGGAHAEVIGPFAVAFDDVGLAAGLIIGEPLPAGTLVLDAWVVPTIAFDVSTGWQVLAGGVTGTDFQVKMSSNGLQFVGPGQSTDGASSTGSFLVVANEDDRLAVFITGVNAAGAADVYVLVQYPVP